MVINDKTLEKLQKLINEEIEYRSGSKLVTFFNSLGFKDSYGEGFPSRWKYTQEKLEEINGKPELDICIKKIFSPINFIDNLSLLDTKIDDFNKYLMFDNWKIIRNGKEINFKKVDDKYWEQVCNNSIKTDSYSEHEFLKLEIKYDVDKLNLEENIKDVIKQRMDEIEKALNYEMPLSSIILSGSTLEGILLGYASNMSKKFNMAIAAPKDRDRKVKPFNEWKLNDLINVATEIGFLQPDVSKFSQILREFRNYIHPYEQLISKFSPNINTAKICCQVLKLAINELASMNNKQVNEQ